MSARFLIDSKNLMKVDYYKNEILYRLMPQLEKLLGDKLFHESYPEMEQQFWQHVDDNDGHRLHVLYNHLRNEIDRANNIIVNFK